MSEHYDFHYHPTGSGAISGQQVLEQTEDAINELGDYVNDNVGGAMDVAQQALETAQTANTNAQTALDTANSFSGAIQSAQQDASTALSTAQTAQTTASNANNTAIQASQDASLAVTTANNASGQVSTLSGTVTALGQRVTTAEGNIGQNTSDITALTTRVGTAEGNITTLQNDVSIAQGNASSAMATAGTVKQQSYVLRYSSTAVTDNSTIAFSTLDNTDNIKSGDKVIDMDGKIFSVVSVDTANQTVTVGSALIDIALDSNVVHTSGNETVGGAKTFDDNLTIYNSDGTQTPKGLTIKNAQWSMGESGSTTVSNINFLDKNSSVPASVMASKGLYGQSYLRFSVRTKDSQNNTYSEEIYYDIDTSGNVEFRSWHDNIVSFGTSTYKWKDVQTNLVNGLTPSSLGMPSGNIADQVDISGYFTNIGSGNTNSYTALANGWIYLRLGDISSCQATVYDANNNRMWGQSSTGSVEQLTIPILKGQTLSTKWNTTLSVNVTNAKFIPCQGNI